jgi:hypothetical protein
MSESTRRVDLRLTIPASAPWREVAAELAVKFAEYAGAPAQEAAGVSRAVADAIAAAGARPRIDFLFSADDEGHVTATVVSTGD